jgi:CarD family transcriptional regulator
MPTNWSRRFKNHVEKLKSGDIYQVAEVVRNLSIREADKGLSAGEKRMLARARQILVSELTFALNVDEEAAELRLDDVLAGRDKPAPKPAKAAKPVAKATKTAAKPATANGAADAPKPAKAAAAKTTKAAAKK